MIYVSCINKSDINDVLFENSYLLHTNTINLLNYIQVVKLKFFNKLLQYE